MDTCKGDPPPRKPVIMDRQGYPGHLKSDTEECRKDTDTSERDTDTSEVTLQVWQMGIYTTPQNERASVLNPNSISATPKPVPVNIAKIDHTSWISVYDLILWNLWEILLE